MRKGWRRRRWLAIVAGLAAVAAFAWALVRRPRVAEAPAHTPAPEPSSAPAPPAPGAAPQPPPPNDSTAIGHTWQWAGAILVATTIVASWWFLHERLGRPEEALATPISDRRSAIETAVSVPLRVTRLSADAIRATQVAAPPTTAPVVGIGPGAFPPQPTVTPAPIALRSPEGPLLRGMGYNPTYATADVAPARRSELLGRDLRLMASVGVNMVLGWEPGVFDEPLLNAARENDVSVIMPFDLKPEWDYGDPEVRLEILRDVAAWVARYRERPAIVMWGVGNEVTLEMTDFERRNFADFYVDVFDLVRALDPSRPVILREAEDVFAPYLAEAFARRQGIPIDDTPTPEPTLEGGLIPDDAPLADLPTATPTPRPVIVAPVGFIYGVNFYTDRIGPALNDWVANTGLDAPLLVSEYAPAGMSRVQRPSGFGHMYELIRSVGPRIVGTAPYTWTTAGPEAVDAYFGIVDGEGRPVDATAASIARMYGVDRPPAWTLGVGPAGAELASGADLPRLLGEAVMTAARQTDLETDEIIAGVELRAAEADEELGLPTPLESEGDQRVHEVGRLVGWAHELAEMRDPTGRRLFPGMREALPLLKGMARWAREEQSAVDTAKDFTAAVLRRDLAVLNG